MPYIVQSRRIQLAEHQIAVTAGELTYKITLLLRSYLKDHGESYTTYATMLGALRGAELDLWDRKVRPYEHGRRAENGDVW